MTSKIKCLNQLVSNWHRSKASTPEITKIGTDYTQTVIRSATHRLNIMLLSGKVIIPATTFEIPVP